MTERTVRDATFEVLRRLELTTIFSNPGSTEVPFLAGLPEDLTFVLGLHEGSVVAMAAGHAIGRGAPSLALLHSTPGLGNAVAALATARSNRAPLVVIVGQQDRRHLALDPFLAGRLHGLAGEYPVWSDQPARAAGRAGRDRARLPRGRDRPRPGDRDRADGRLARARPRGARGRSGPSGCCARRRPTRPRSRRSRTCSAQAEAPAIVAGAGADGGRLERARRAGRAARLPGLPGAVRRPGRTSRRTIRCSPATCPPAARGCARCSPPHDVVLVVGTGALRQYPFDPGPLVRAGTRMAVVTQDPEEAHRSPVELAVLGDPAAICAALAAAVDPRGEADTPGLRRPAPPPPPAAGEPLRAGHVLAALAERLPRDAILVEETPSSRPELHARVATTEPLGFVSAMGMLGFALPAAIGLRMARPDRPVLTVVGDGSSLYQIQALWSAARYRVGVLFVVLSNGGYAIMDRLAERTGAPGPWPRDRRVDIGAMARALGCDARAGRAPRRAARAARRRARPPRRRRCVLEVVVAPDETFDP